MFQNWPHSPEKGRHSVGVLGFPALVLWVAEKGLLAEAVATPWKGCALQHHKEGHRQWEVCEIRLEWAGPWAFTGSREPVTVDCG